MELNEVMADDQKIYQKAMNDGHSAAWDQDWGVAAENYRIAAEARPQSHQAINSLGLALFELKNFEESRLCYMQASSLMPESPLPLERLAEIYERTGKIKKAVAQSMLAADLQLKSRDIGKAIENWIRVTRLAPDHVKAHSRLALVYERLRKKNLAINEYIAVASLLQHSGRIGDALLTVERGMTIDPSNVYIQDAVETLKANRTLPKPIRQPGGTGPLRMAAVMGMNIPIELENLTKYGPNPVAEARQHAITAQAEFLFDLSEEDLKSKKAVSGLRSMFGRNDSVDIDQIALCLGSAIDFQTKAAEKDAADHLKMAIEAGVNIPAVFFNLGYLYMKLGKVELGLKNIQKTLNDPDYSLASHLLIGEYWVNRGNLKEAVLHYANALKYADIAVIDAKWQDDLSNAYEAVIESLTQEDDQEVLSQLGSNIVGLIMQNDWRSYVSVAREQLPPTFPGNQPIPLSEILIEASDTEILSAMTNISQMAKKGYMRAAMEEAFRLIDDAPTYLPLHIQMAELSMNRNHNAVAIDKFKVIAKTYAVRGESKRANDMYRRVINLSPMDISSRNALIEYLLEQANYEQAVEEYIELADTNYQLAQLDNARSTYEIALDLAQKQNLSVKWVVKIYKYIADIDMQRLDWRQALRVFEQLRTLAPTDEEARKHLYSLNMKLGHASQAQLELDGYLDTLSNIGEFDQSIKFLEEILSEDDQSILARTRLAVQFQKTNRVNDAIEQWNIIAQKSMAEDNKEGAKQALRAILVLNPPDVNKYRTALQNLN